MKDITNPSKIQQPKLKSPIGRSENPYKKFRRKVLRRNMWGR